MVVDDIEMAGDKQRRRFLVYDCMMLAGEGISDLRFEVRRAAAQGCCALLGSVTATPCACLKVLPCALLADVVERHGEQQQHVLCNGVHTCYLRTPLCGTS